MGYYTYYSLQHDCTDAEKFERIVAEMEKMKLFDYCGLYADVDMKLFYSNDIAKWYDWEEDMRKVSAAFPEVHFTLHGEGEDNGDLWDAHFLGGKMQYCPAKIVYDEFDPEQLH